MKKISNINKILCVLAIMSTFLMRFANADLEIVIQKEVATAQPIAVVPFKGSTPENIAEIISNDLRYTGKFNPMDPSKMPQLPGTANEVTPDLWTSFGIGGVVVGQISSAGSGYDINYELVDITGQYTQAGSAIMHGNYHASAQELRYVAHTISDAIFEKLTNIKGAARTRLAYVAQQGPRSYNITVSDYDGMNSYVVYKSSEPVMKPAWSADGQVIAFSTFEGRQSKLILQNLKTGNRVTLSSLNGHNGAPAFSPNGKWLVFAGSENDGKLNLYLSDTNGNGQVRLTDVANNTEPSWSPDGNSIYFTSDRDGKPAVYKMDVYSKTASKVGGNNTYSPQLSADNKNLIFIQEKSLMANNLETGAITPITDTYLDESPSISPNGLMVVYNATQGVSKSLQLVSIDGNFRARIPASAGEVKYPAWSPFLVK